MRFSTILFGAFAVFASAQTTDSSSSTDVATTTVSSASTSVSLTPAESSEAACLNACDVSDVNCRAGCIAVPAPSAQQANATNECVANCNQGNGTAAENDAYASCVSTCVADNYYTSTGTPAETTAASGSTGSAASASATGTGSSASGSSSGTSTGTSTGTATGSSASSTSSNSAADAIRAGVTGASLFGLLAAFMAL